MLKAAVFLRSETKGEENIKRHIIHIQRCGIEPIEITGQSARELLSDCKYLIVCGQEEEYFKEESYESLIINSFLAQSKPILGICAGMQSINRVLGGTLIEDICSQLSLCHKGCDKSAYMHEIKISKSSKLHKDLGLRAIVNSYHNKCVHDLGSGILVAAASHDGVIEAIEGEKSPILGVQWNPEYIIGNNIYEHFFSTYK